MKPFAPARVPASAASSPRQRMVCTPAQGVFIVGRPPEDHFNMKTITQKSQVSNLKSRIRSRRHSALASRRPLFERLEERTVLAFSFGSAFQIGSPRAEGSVSIDRDESGNVYISGDFQDTVDLNPGPGTYSLTSLDETNDYYDGFVAKYSPAGVLLWATQFDYSAGDVAVHGNDLYVFVHASNASGQRGLTKLDATTGAIQWLSPVAAYGAGIAVDSTGDVYLATNASYSPSGFTVGATVSKINPATGTVIWSAATAYSGDLGASTNDIAVSGSGSVYVTGSYIGTVDFDTGAGSFPLTSIPTSSFNKQDAFLWKLNAATGQFEWAGSLGGNGSDFGTAIAIDSANNVYLAGQWAGGQTSSQNDFAPGSSTLTLPRYGSSDIFVEKFIPNTADGGRTLKASWAKSLGGSSVDGASEIALDAAGSIYVGGYFSNTVDFDPSSKKYNLTSTGFLDAFVCQLTAGGAFVAATKIGSGGNDFVYGIAIDGLGSVYLAGTFVRTADFDPGRGTFNMTASSGDLSQPDIYISRYTVPGSESPTSAPRSIGSSSAASNDDALLLYLAEGLDSSLKRR